MEALNFQLVVFHPYRPLLQYNTNTAYVRVLTVCRFASDAGLDDECLDAAWYGCGEWWSGV